MPTTVFPKRPSGSGRRSTSAPSSVRNEATQRPTSLTPSGVYEPQSMSTSRCRSSRYSERSFSIEVRRASISRSAVVSMVIVAASLRGVEVAILPGPCDWSRSASSKARTCTGWSRWSRSSSPSAGAAPGTASATRPGTPSSTWAPTSRRMTGRTASPRSPRGSGGCGSTTARVGRAWPSTARRTPGTGSSRSRGPARSGRARWPRPPSPSPSATCRRRGPPS